MLNKNRNYIRATWRVINNAINNHKKKPSNFKLFETENVAIFDSTKIANSFNEFFVNVGQNLVASIPKTKAGTADENLIMDNVNSIFLDSVEKD